MAPFLKDQCNRTSHEENNLERSRRVRVHLSLHDVAAPEQTQRHGVVRMEVHTSSLPDNDSHEFVVQLQAVDFDNEDIFFAD